MEFITEFITDLLIFHPKIFKIILVIVGVLLVFILMSILHFLGKKKKEIKAEELMEEVKNREKYLQERKDRLNNREKEFEKKLVVKYKNMKKNYKKNIGNKFRQEINKITGLTNEEIVERYGKMVKNNNFDSLWDNVK